MIGEIRDQETAKTAVRAANSGHLVLSTLHSPLAAGAVQSMLAYGVSPYFLSNCLVGIVAQRLVRCLSQETRLPFDVSHSPEIFEDVQHVLTGEQGKFIYGPDVNDKDSQEGYIGQTGLFEVMSINGRVRSLIAESASAREIHQSAVESGMLDFQRAAMLKVACGLTSVEEASRVVPNIEFEM